MAKSASAWPRILELGAWALVIVLVAGYAHYAATRPQPPKPTKLGHCRPPAEFEQLHIVVTNRGAEGMVLDCMYVAPSKFYRKPETKALANDANQPR